LRFFRLINGTHFKSRFLFNKNLEGLNHYYRPAKNILLLSQKHRILKLLTPLSFLVSIASVNF